MRTIRLPDRGDGIALRICTMTADTVTERRKHVHPVWQGGKRRNSGCGFTLTACPSASRQRRRRGSDHKNHWVRPNDVHITACGIHAALCRASL